MATIISLPALDYGVLGVTTQLEAMLITSANKKKAIQVKEIIGETGDIESLVLYNQKMEITLDGYLNQASFDKKAGDALGGAGNDNIFIDTVNRSFSSEDAAKMTVSATKYAGLTAQN